MAITLGLVEAVDDNGVYVSMPGSRGVLRGPYRALDTVAAGVTVLVTQTDDGEQVVVGAVHGGDGAHNVRSFGAKGDGATDDTAAIQAAIDAAEGGGVVHFPPGNYVCAGALTVPNWVKLRGSLVEPGSSAGYTVIRFTTDTDAFNAITCGSYVTIENLMLRGTYSFDYTTDGILADSITMSNVSVGGFWRGLHMTDGYYSNLTRCEFTRNAKHIELTGCYNVNLYGCQFTDDTTYGHGASTAIVADAVRSLNVFGGAVENYKYGIWLASGGVHLFGVYFETGFGGYVTDAFGVYAGGSNGVNVVMNGCTIYLNGTDSFVYADDGAVNTTINSHGNYFCSGASGAGAAFKIGANTSSGSYFSLSGDSWAGVSDTSASYVEGAINSGPKANAHIELPAQYTSGAWSTAGPSYVFEGRDLFLGGKVGFYGTAPISKPAVTGSRGGNAALASLLTQLANLGLITDGSS